MLKVIYVKKRHIYSLLIIICILIILSIVLIKNKSIPTINPLIIDKIIGIDPGHGGMDPGTVSKNGILEADINLKIALKLKDIIEQNGGKVIITRENKNSLADKKREDLDMRREIIEKGNCDIFLSIHLNSFKDSRYYGAQVFYNEDFQENRLLAECIQEELRLILDINNTRVPQKRDDVYLLNGLNIPSVLIECGFLSNEEEEKLLQLENYQKKIAQGIYNGIIKFLEEMNEKDRLNVDKFCG